MHINHLRDEVSLNRHTPAVASDTRYAHSNASTKGNQVNKSLLLAAGRLVWLPTCTIHWLPFQTGRVSLPLKTTVTLQFLKLSATMKY